MKNRKLMFVVLACVLCVLVLCACGSKKASEATPAPVLVVETPTPAAAATPEATPTPTPEATPTPTPDIYRLKEYTMSSGEFSLLIPENAEVSEGTSRVIVQTSNAKMEIVFDEIIDRKYLYECTDVTHKELADVMSVTRFEGFGHVTDSVSDDGVHLVTAPIDQVSFWYDMDTEIECSARYAIYDSEYTGGVYVAYYFLYNVDYKNMQAEDEESDNMWRNCLMSLHQIWEPDEASFVSHQEEFTNGTEVEFAYYPNYLEEIKRQESGIALNLYYSEEDTEYIIIEHYAGTDTIKTAEDYYESVQKRLDTKKYHFTDIKDYEGYLDYGYWEVSYDNNGIPYVETVATCLDPNGGMINVIWFRPEEFADNGQALYFQILMSLRILTE